MFSSGMAAISTTLWTFLRPGDVLVHSEPLYGGTEFLIHNILPAVRHQPEGFGAGGVGPHDRGRRSRRPKEHGRVAVIFLETPANPTNGLVDIARCAEHRGRSCAASRAERPPVIVDNTFLGPLWQQPLAHGADLVVYSLTKYVGGHSDVIAGALPRVPKRTGRRVRGMRTILGTMSDPHTGWLLMRSLETLKLRMTSAMKNARYVAEFLTEHPKVDKVHYLGFLADGRSRLRRSTGASARRRARPSRSRSTAARPRPSACSTPQADPARGQPRRHREPGRASRHHDPLRHPAGPPGASSASRPR